MSAELGFNQPNFHITETPEKKPSKVELYSKKVTQNPWKLKLCDLQDRLSEEQDAAMDLLKNYNTEEVNKLPEEEQKKAKEEFGKELQRRNSNIKTLRQAVKEHVLNKNMSSFFQWLPNPNGMNRRQARLLRRNKKR